MRRRSARARLVDRADLSRLVATDHSADAGGDPALLDAKRALREEIWEALTEAGAAAFPGARGRIPNFSGAAAAADALRTTDPWAAEAVKANPDGPQRPVRERALADGKRCYMAVPRLAEPDPFFALDPESLEATPRQAASIKGAERHGQRVSTDRLEPVGLVVVGCVAVDRRGARLGKGGGFADLELAMATEAGLVGAETVVATTVHPTQVVEPGRIPVADHDVPVDLIATPEGLVWTDGGQSRPRGLRWAELTEDKIAAIPLLARLRASMEESEGSAR
jgi:5-formyltetrahydrofolate cyclo-ligase